MDYEKAVRKWAANRLGLNPDTIKSVDFGMDQKGYCETCSYDVVGVEVVHTIPNKKTKSGVSLNYEFIDLGYESFASVLQEILEVN